jgi:hypothetical protein
MDELDHCPISSFVPIENWYAADHRVSGARVPAQSVRQQPAITDNSNFYRVMMMQAH